MDRRTEVFSVCGSALLGFWRCQVGVASRFRFEFKRRRLADVTELSATSPYAQESEMQRESSFALRGWARTCRWRNARFDRTFGVCQVVF